MKEVHFDPTDEPFGQRGVLPYLWPGFVLLCAIGFCTCLIMLQRSATLWDTFSNTDSNRQLIVSSVIGRLVITVKAPPPDTDATRSIWDFDSRNFENIRDGWAEGWLKTLGVQWGPEMLPEGNRQPTPSWRLRIRWRTLAVLYALPVAIELTRRLRRRHLRPHSAHQLDHAVTGH